MKKKQLMVFPFAGGNANFYKNYFDDIKQFFDVLCIEARGHGSRSREGLLYEFSEYSNDCFSQVYSKIYADEIVLFGHSMGGYTAFDIALKMAMLLPEIKTNLVISGINPPQVIINKKSQLEDELFLEYFNRNRLFYGELAENPKLQWLYLPVIKADMSVCESYILPSGACVNCDINILYGSDDLVTSYEKLLEWRKLTTANFSINQFKGGHFFICDLENRKKINSLINSLSENRRIKNVERNSVCWSGITV